MALSGHEAQHFAECFVSDIRADVEPDPISVYAALGPDDQLRLGRHLVPILTGAQTAFNDGDRSPGVLKRLRCVRRWTRTANLPNVNVWKPSRPSC